MKSHPCVKAILHMEIARNIMQVFHLYQFAIFWRKSPASVAIRPLDRPEPITDEGLARRGAHKTNVLLLNASAKTL